MDSGALERVTVEKVDRRDRRKSRRRLALAACVLALTVGAAWYAEDWWTVGRFIEGTDDAYIGGNVTPLAPHIDAFVQRILVTDNQRVHAGELLIQLDGRDYRTALDHAEAMLKARLAAVDSLHAQYALQQSTIRRRAADLAARNAGAAFAAEDATRYRLLEQATVGSRQQAQRSLALRQEAQSAVAAAEAGLEAARQQLEVLHARIAEADAAVEAVRADLRTAQLNLGYTEIRSPIDGFVGNRAAQVGAYVTKGTYLISVTPAAGLWVDANFKEDQLTRMVPGQVAAVRADVLPGHVFRGHVVSLSPGTGAVFSVIPPENATGNFTKIVQRVPVRITLDPGDPNLAMLRPGLSTVVRVDTRGNRGAS